MKSKKCATKFCQGIVLPSMRSPLCAACHSRQWKQNHPIEYTFNKIKFRAKERGHEFLLTLEEFRAFVARTGYMGGKGKTSESLSIDRIRNEEGYHKENIRVLTLRENSGRLRNAPIHIVERYAFA